MRSGRNALLPENTVVATSELSAPADAAALEAAFAQLQREHDVLRMLVSWNGTCWVSRTATEPALPFTVSTVEGDDAAAFERALEALGDEAFDPVERPLGRGVLLQQGSRAAVALVLHRALTMPLSTEALLERLLELYVREHVAAPAR